MNFEMIDPIIGTAWYLIPLFILLIPLFILMILVKSSWFKGVLGEFIVNLSAKLFLDKNKYHLIKNVTLPTEDGSTQIDHVIVSRYGVFVIETKNMKGWIFGNPNQRTWTQKIYNHSSKFQNPLRQNYKHVKTLEALLGLEGEQVFSVVVFVGDSTFKTKMPENVVHGTGYIQFIKSKGRLILSALEVKGIVDKIETGRLVSSFRTNRVHVKHVKEIISKKENNNRCPKCGSQMIVRESKRGQNKGNTFWGCTNFPKCRGIVNIT